MIRDDNKFYSVNSFIAGLVLALAIWIVVQITRCGLDWLKDWQTLITGLLASAAGFLAFFGIRQQIIFQGRLEEEKRLKRNMRDRASLSQPLSNLIGMCRRLIAKMSKPIDDSGSYLVEGNPLVKMDFGNFEQLPQSDLLIISDTIQFADIDPALDISQLVADLQVLNANLNSIEGKDTVEESGQAFLRNAYNYIWRTVLIFARAQRLLYYARRQDEDYYSFTVKESAKAVVLLCQIDSIQSALTKYINDKIEAL